MAFFIVPIIGTMNHVPKLGTLKSLWRPTMTPTAEQLQALADILMIGFLESLFDREVYLTLSQLHTRQFTPHTQLTRDCICYLRKQGRVQLSLHRSPRKKRRIGKPDDLIISVPAKNIQSGPDFIFFNQTLKIRMAEPDCSMLVHYLDLELQAYECVEYVRFYLEREELSLTEEQGIPDKIRVLLLELHQEQVCMLLWRAVKTSTKYSLVRGKKSVSLSDLCNKAYKYFIHYRKAGTDINHYGVPRSVSNSILRNVLIRFNPPDPFC